MGAMAEGRRRALLLAGLGAAATVPGFAGCATTPLGHPPGSSAEVIDEPGYVAAPTGTLRRTALVLSGGGVRGFAHLGVLRVLEREGLRPDLVVGSSAGAMVGALFASGMTSGEIERAAGKLDWTVLFDIDPLRAVLGGLGLGLVPGARLEQFLRQHLPLPIERLPLAFAAVAADMESGDVVPLNNGDTPVLAARRLGAMRVLAIDVAYPPAHSEMSSPILMLFQSLIVSGWRQLLAERALADLVITPQIRTSSQLGLGSRDWLIEAGEKAAQFHLVEIRRLFAES